MPANESIFLPDDEPPVKKRSRAGRAVVWSLLVALIGAVGLEAWAAYCRSASAERLRALIISREGGRAPELNDVRNALAGWPRQTELLRGNQRQIIFTWPSLIRSYRIRARIDDRRQVATLDVPQGDDDDVIEPIAVAGDNGLAAAPHPGQSQRLSSGEMLTKVREAFAQPRELLGKGILVFPVVDDQERIHPAGAGLSTIASYSTICVPRKRLAIDPRRARNVLLAGDCWRPGTTVDSGRIDLCTRAAGVVQYVIPRLQAADDGWSLTVEYHAGREPRGDKTFEHHLAGDEIPKVPALIALDLLEHLRVELAPADRDWVLAPQIREEGDAVRLAECIDSARRRVFPPPNIGALVERNPGCVAGWDLLASEQSGLQLAVQVPEPHRAAVLACPSIRRAQALAPLSRNDSASALAGMLKLAPQERGEPRWHSELIDCALRMQDDQLVAALFDIWEQEGDDYPNCLSRGVALLNWGEQARSRTDAEYRVSREDVKLMRERVLRARKQFDRALELNPLGWGAHRELIQVAMRLELPFPGMQQHFLSAIQLCPTDSDVYRKKFRYLWKVSFGTHDNLLDLARECVDSGQWSEGIPQLLPDVLAEAIADRPNRAFRYRDFQSPVRWELLKDYYAGAQRQPDKKVERYALNYFAVQAVLGGHFPEAAAAFDRLDVEEVQPQRPGDARHGPPRIKTDYDPGFFVNGDFQYAHLRDRVRAATDPTSAGKLAAVRQDLAELRLDDAASSLDMVQPANEDEAAELERCRRALALGRRLTQQRKLDLTAQEAIEVFAEFRRTSCRGLERNGWWNVEDGKLVWNYPGYNQENGWVQSTQVFFPLGLGHAAVSGTVAAEGIPRFEIVAHSQALRDPVFLEYQVGNMQARLQRHNESWQNTRLGTGPWGFSLEYAPLTDRMAAVPAAVWETVVTDDVPSTFGFVIHGTSARQKFSISNLKIELRD